jgi:TonB-linked SusC/RagA family outer membrane protein
MIACTLLSISLAFGQAGEVSGTVLIEDGSPAVGASVLIKGTTRGAYTDDAGKFSVSVPEEVNELVISFLEYITQEVDITGKTSVRVSLQKKEAEEVVITALGVSREKKTLGYATQQVDGEEVTKVKDVNFIQSLSGKVAGVDINRSNTLGGSANVVVRGYKSLTGNNQALFVVDGTIISNSNTNTTDQRTGRGGYDYGNAAMDINPEDIESISVLKGAAATALYGSRAANGVILITTKKGKNRKGIGVTISSGLTMGNIDKSTMPRYQKEYGPGYSTVRGWYGSGGVAEDPNGFDYYDFGSGSVLAPAVYEDASFGPKFNSNLMVPDWRSYYEELGTFGEMYPYVAAENDPTTFYETSAAWNNSIALEGGSNTTNFRLGYTNFDMKGITPNSKITRHNLNFTAGADISKRLNVSATANYVLTNGRSRYGTGYDNRNPNQSFRQWYSTNVDLMQQKEAYEQTGKNISWNPYAMLDPDRLTQPHYFDNYYFSAFENVPTDQRSRIFGNVMGTYKLTDWLTLTGRMATDRYSEIQEERIAVGSVDVSSYNRFNRSFYENNLDIFADFRQKFGASDNIDFSAMLGTNIRRTGIETIFAETNGGLVVPGIYALQNSAAPIEAPTETKTTVGVNGYFGRVSVGFNSLLYLDLTGRYDVSSTLPEDNNGYFYPSASLSFIFSEALGTSDFLSFGKIRFNYAEVGNSAPANSTFDIYNINTPFAGVPMASASNTQRNPMLLPENTRNFEAGIEANFFQNRVGLDLSWYRANSYNQILPVDVTGATGNLFKYVNAGEIQNQGIELSLRLVPIQTTDFNWEMRVNWTRNRNEVISLFGDQTNLQLSTAQGGISTNATIGEPYGTIRGTDHIYHTDGSPIVIPHPFGGVRFAKTSSPTVVGDINPQWLGGINNAFRYKNLSLSFLIDIQKGGNFFSLDTWYGFATGIYDITAGQNENRVDVRADVEEGGGIFIPGTVVSTGTDPESGLPISDGTPNEEAFYASDVYTSLGYVGSVGAPTKYHIYDAGFIKLREVNLTYSLPASLIEKTPFAGVDVSLIGRNLWIIHKNTEYSDPEAGLSAGNVQGNQSGAYPAVREIGANLRVRF